MKKLLFGLMMMLMLVPAVNVEAQDATDSAQEVTESSEDGLDSTIKSLKEKIEDKVEEINKSSKKIVVGIIDAIGSDTIEVLTDSDARFTVSLDDTISSYFSTSLDGKEDIDQSDLEEGDYIVVSGPVIEDQVSANTILKQTQYIVLQGQITATDSNNFTIGVVTPEKDEYQLDIEENTEQQIMNTKTLALEAGGFSKYKVGDSIHFVIEYSDEDASSYSAIRTLIIPQEFFVDTTPADDTTDSEEETAE